MKKILRDCGSDVLQGAPEDSRFKLIVKTFNNSPEKSSYHQVTRGASLGSNGLLLRKVCFSWRKITRARGYVGQAIFPRLTARGDWICHGAQKIFMKSATRMLLTSLAQKGKPSPGEGKVVLSQLHCRQGCKSRKKEKFAFSGHQN